MRVKGGNNIPLSTQWGNEATIYNREINEIEILMVDYLQFNTRESYQPYANVIEFSFYF